MQRQINLNTIYITILIITSLISCQSFKTKWPNDVVSLEKEISINGYLFNDIEQIQDESSDLLSGFAEGPFPKVPNQYSAAERLDHIRLKKYSKMEVSDDSIKMLYRRVVMLENYFKNHARDADLEKNGINQDIIIQATSESSHVLQYLLYKKFATIKTNRYEEDSLNSVQSVLHADKNGRTSMLRHLHTLCENYGYTLTAYLWSGKDSKFGSDQARTQRTEALNYFLQNEC